MVDRDPYTGLFKYEIAGLYSRNGKCERWKEEADRLFGPAEALKIWDKLKEQGYLPFFKRDLTFVSPTANYPTHEIAIFEKEAKLRQGRTLFIVGDIIQINPYPPIKKINQKTKPKGEFYYCQWDADNLPIKEKTVDVIWDRKGWLWHLASGSSRLSNKTQRRLTIEAFRKYHAILKPGGILIIDANEKRIGRAERSTVKMIEFSFCLDGSQFWDDLSRYFQIQYCQAEDQRFMVLAKTPISSVNGLK